MMNLPYEVKARMDRTLCALWSTIATTGLFILVLVGLGH
jgi:hypothetical protein